MNRGEAFFRLDNSLEARRIWKKLRDTRRETSKRPAIVAEAAYRIAKTYRIPEPGDDKELALGVRSLDDYIALFPNHEKAPQAALDKAKAYFHRQQYENARQAFQALLDRHAAKATPQQKAAAEFHIARCQLELQKFDEAAAAFEAFLKNHPVDENWREAQQMIVFTRYRKVENEQREAEKALNRWTRDVRADKKDPIQEAIPGEILAKFASAREGWETFQSQYPLDSRIPGIQLLLGKNERRLRRFEEAMAVWKDIATRFPNSDTASEALYLIAEVTEMDLKDYEKALDLYKEVTFGPFQGSAQDRIRQLQEIFLALRTERTFLTNENPTLRFTSRNIESVTCKLYPLDLPAYFQSRHTIRSIEDLDVNLIAPEKVWEVTPEAYKPYKLIEQDLAIPVKGPGSWVVQVESKTLQVVTLVVVSDLAAVIKGGKNEVFVYAEDQKNEKAVEGADVWVSDGQTILAQGKTNGDGVFQKTGLNALEKEQLSVFAAYRGHCAGETLPIQHLSVAASLQPRYLVYTDRAAYQPGETVQYRALIREIQDGRYIIPQDYDFDVTIFDSRGTPILTKQSKLSEFGTLNGELALGASAPFGTYRIAVSREDGPSGAWTFEVQEFTLPTARVEIETGQTTYFYGDKITGTIRVSDFSGNPLAGERITYTLAGGFPVEAQEAVTDSKGEASIEFETWDMPEECVFAVVAVLPSRQIQQQKNLALVNTGFTITLDTTRDVYLVNEPFQVNVGARGRDEKREALAVPLQISLQRRNEEGAYETVERQTVTTPADENRAASVSFTAKKGGRYQILAEGSDRRGTAVTSQRNVQISGEDDANKLLVLNDRSSYQQGDTASFTVVSRLPENLCVFTGEREGIVEYRVERIKPGKNEITWKLDGRYSPTATVSLAVMHGNQDYLRDVRFQVRRGLDVTITPNAKTFTPRGKAELTVAAHDHTGKPVVAEFSLGLVDSAFLALFPDRLDNLAAYFEQAGGGNFLAAASSAGFRYDGITRPISEEILAERAGAEIELLGEEEARAGLRAGRAVREQMESIDAMKYQEEQSRRRVLARGAVTEAQPPAAEAPVLAPAVQGALMLQDRPMDANGAVRFDDISLSENKQAGQVIAGEPVALSAGVPVMGKMFYGTGQTHGFAGGMGMGMGMGGMGGMGGAGAYYFGYGGYGTLDPAAAIQARADFPLTAYFNASVITDANGQATVSVPLPDSLTTWEAAARAITKDTLVNQAREKIVVDKPFRLELETPAFLTEGDRSSALAIVRNNTPGKLPAQNVFTQTIGERPETVKWESELDAGALRKQVVALAADTIGDTSLTLTSLAQDLHDKVVKPIPVYPWGIPVRAGASGITGQSMVQTISLPSQADYSRMTMWITLGGTGDVSLLQAAWSSIIGPRSNRGRIEQGLGALAAWECVESLKKTGQVPVPLLRQRIEAAVQHALATQTDQGLWSWGGGPSGAPDILTTSRAAELLRQAKDRGFTVPGGNLERAINQLMNLYQQTANDDEKTRILYAWSVIQPPDFTFVNRIHRNLARMNDFDAALLGLTWFNMGRPEKAREVLDHLLASPGLSGAESVAPSSPNTPVINVGGSGSNETLALAARLYFQLPPASRTPQQTAKFLEKLAVESPWPLCVEAYGGLRLQALAAYLMSAAEETSSYTLAVKVNGHDVLQRRTTRSVLPYERVDIDPEWIKPADNRVEFAFNGQGRFRYGVVLEGWTKQEVRPQDWMTPQDRRITVMEREYTHGPLMYKQEDMPRGYGVVEGSYSTVSNKLEEIQPGERVNVQLRIEARNDVDYVVVEDHIPAGFLFIKESLQGSVDQYTLKGNTLTFYLRGPRRYFSIQYQLRGRYSGTYRVPPATVTVMEDPGSIYATASNTIVVLPEGKQPKEEYHPTPDELYTLGLRNFDDKHYEEAKRFLTQLFNTVVLRPEPYLETARRLFQIHLQGNDARELVRYFEIIKERDQEFEIQFEHIAKLAQAYRAIGEPERAVYVYRSLLDGLFTQEGAVTGTLQEVGQYREALDYIKQLILEYPDIPSVQTAVFTTGGVIYQNVDSWARQPDFIQSGNDQKALLAEAVGMIQSFLALYPKNPVADEAGYTLINLWLDQKNYETVARLAASFAKRYPQSTYLDSYDYLAAYALFQLERYTSALELAQKVATQKYPAEGGGQKPSDEANTAILMSGKILHAAGELDRALAEYERVKQAFGDAGQSIAYLTEKGLKIDGVTLVHGDDPATVTLRHKNLDAIDMRVYKVDLMAFYLTERNLDRMTQINLSGIQPTISQTIPLDKAKKFEWIERKLDLPLHETGAYLVVLSGNGLLTSGMVIRTGLELEVLEDAPQGIARVNVRSGMPLKFAKNVKVQVRGSRNDQFVSGETDLRGVFTATGIQGTATVLVQDGSQYGFYQGTRELGQPPVPTEQAGQPEGPAKGVPALDFGLEDIGNNMIRMRQVQERQSERWQNATGSDNYRLSTQKAKALY
ncbi:MAG: MG2 domain-containing protein [bacterium]